MRHLALYTVVALLVSACGGGPENDRMDAYGEVLTRLGEDGTLDSIQDAVDASIESGPVHGSVVQSGFWNGEEFVAADGVDRVFLAFTGDTPIWNAHVVYDHHGVPDAVDFTYFGGETVDEMEQVAGSMLGWRGVKTDHDIVYDRAGHTHRVATSWASWDPHRLIGVVPTNDEYVLGGYWLEAKEYDDGTYHLGSLGAFVDAPADFSGAEVDNWRDLGASLDDGPSAIYEGEAHGIYAGYQPASNTAEDLDVWHVGDFTGDIWLQAIFGAGGDELLQEISGRVDNIAVDYTYVREGGLDPASGMIDPARYTIHLQSAQLMDGMNSFDGDVTLRRDDVHLDDAEGSWGGEISRIRLGNFVDEPPRMVAGTFGGTGTFVGEQDEIEGATVSFVGSFAAGPEVVEYELPPDN